LVVFAFMSTPNLSSRAPEEVGREGSNVDAVEKEKEVDTSRMYMARKSQTRERKEKHQNSAHRS
jgi:hypothetical protein